MSSKEKVFRLCPLYISCVLMGLLLRAFNMFIQLRENESCILINLQKRKHIYLYSSVRAKKETKLESS